MSWVGARNLEVVLPRFSAEDSTPMNHHDSPIRPDVASDLCRRERLPWLLGHYRRIGQLSGHEPLRLAMADGNRQNHG